MADKKITMLYGLLTSIASKITYDNSTSGLSADNVQDALDEVKSDVDELTETQMDSVTYNGVTWIFKKFGKIVMVDGAGTTINSQTSSEQIPIPIGFTPATNTRILNMYTPSWNDAYTFNSAGRFFIVNNSVSSGQIVRCNGVYATAE